MKLSSFRYVGPQCFRSMLHNGWMTVAALLTITIALFLCAFFWALLVNVNANVVEVENDVRVLVYVEYSADEAAEQELEQQLKWLDGVSAVEFISREQGIRELQDRYGDTDLISSLGGVNPLPDMFSITALSNDAVSRIAEQAALLDNVYEVRYGEETVQTLFSLTSALRKIGWAVMLMMAVASVLLIAMATSLTIQTRKKEIMIMKWSGATNAFIRWPFVLEGMILGLLGAAIALVLMLLLYSRASAYLIVNVPVLTVVPIADLWLRAVIFTLGGGLVLGTLGSLIPITRFLNV